MAKLAEKAKAIQATVTAIRKQFGQGAIMSLGEGGTLDLGAVQFFSTGAPSLDLALGTGGLPRGRVVEVFGPESSGKTTLALHAIAEVQRAGGSAAFIDAEHALDITYARRLGVQVEDLLISQPDTGEQALEIGEMLVRSGGIDIVVVDSVAALVPRAEIEGEMGDQHMGLQARLMSQAMRKLTAITHRCATTALFVNQIRMKIGVVFGSPETTPGGQALKFYSSVRIEVRRTGTIKDGDQPIGARTRVRVVKNKLAPPFRETEVDIYYGRGICRASDVLDLATSLGVVEKSGAHYVWQGERLGHGRERVRDLLRENAALLAEIEARAREKGACAGPLGQGDAGSAASADDRSPHAAAA